MATFTREFSESVTCFPRALGRPAPEGTHERELKARIARSAANQFLRDARAVVESAPTPKRKSVICTPMPECYNDRVRKLKTHEYDLAEGSLPINLLGGRRPAGRAIESMAVRDLAQAIADAAGRAGDNLSVFTAAVRRLIGEPDVDLPDDEMVEQIGDEELTADGKVRVMSESFSGRRRVGPPRSVADLRRRCGSGAFDVHGQPIN